MNTSFGIIDFVAALLSKSRTKSGIMSVFEAPVRNALDSNESFDADETENTEIFEGLRRRFTVQSANNDYHEILSIDKTDLLQMKIQFKDEFTEFFENGFVELEKTITLRIHAMDFCHKQASIWSIVGKKLEILTNQDLNKMSQAELVNHCKDQMSK